MIVPDDLATAFDRHPGARAHWDAFRRSTRRATLEWISQAKRAETRQRRVAETAERSGRGERPR
ncbi:YdeI/OmpD-associated family protein [Micromonospora coerulea]|uniref:YdeI/OmpD-associated family protein n=1 Tax=Micromonospora coerulea TaxID=47856 RepID=UPI001908070D|nr:YdeI/OmpD-associated family protein [Micromonospora veneta]